MSQDCDCGAVVEAARRLLNKIDVMTSKEFSHGGEREEREALRKALNEMDQAHG